MAASSFIFLFVSVLLFCNFGQIVSSSGLKSYASSRAKNNHATPLDISLGHAGSESLIRSRPTKVADKEIIISAKVKATELKGNTNKAQIPVSANFETDNIKRNTKTVQVPISVNVKSGNLNRNTNKLQIPIG